MDFPGKNTGAGCHFLLQGISWLRDRICVSSISYFGRRILYHQHHLESPESTRDFVLRNNLVENPLVNKNIILGAVTSLFTPDPQEWREGMGLKSMT